MLASTPQEDHRPDAYLVLKSLSLSHLKQTINLQKCYIRALIDDDTYCTHFGKVTPIERSDNGEASYQIEWPDAIYLPLK